MQMPSTPCGGRGHRMQLYVFLSTDERERERESERIHHAILCIDPAGFHQPWTIKRVLVWMQGNHVVHDAMTLLAVLSRLFVLALALVLLGGGSRPWTSTNDTDINRISRFAN